MLHYMRMRIVSMARTERGASAVEYGILVALIVAMVIGAILLLQGGLNSLFTNTATKLEDASK